MGCAESIISNIVAKSNSKGQKVNTNQANGKGEEIIHLKLYKLYK